MGNNCCGSESNKERVLTIEKKESPGAREQDHAKRVAAMQASLTGVPITAGLMDEKQRVREQDHAKRVAAMQSSLTGVPVAMTAGPENGIIPTARRASSDLSKTSPHYAEKLPTYKEALAAASRAADQPSTGKDLSSAFTLPDEGSWI